MQLNNILFPVDFSPSCENVAPHVLAYARQFGARITALSVVDVPWARNIGVSPSVLWDSEETRSIKHRYLETLEAFVREHLPGSNVAAMVREGDAAATITATAAESASDLVMMPTRGLGPFRRYLLGSVTAKVLNDCHCPVWTSVHREEQVPAIPLFGGVLLCAINLEPESVPLLKSAAAFARASAAQLRVIHVIPAMQEESRNRGVIAVRRHLCAEAHEKWCQIQAAAQIDTDLQIAGGNIAQKVACAAKRERAGAVTISRGGIGQLAGGLLTQAYAIIRESPCPVIAM